MSAAAVVRAGFRTDFRRITLSAPIPFSGSFASLGQFDSRPLSWTAAAHVALTSGEYELGFCINNTSDFPADMYSNVVGFFEIAGQ